MKTAFVQPNVNDLTAHHNLGLYRPQLSKEVKARIRELHNNGVKNIKIASLLGLPQRYIDVAIYCLRKQRQVEIQQYTPDPKFQVAQEMWQEGKSVVEIAEYYGYNVRRMNGVIERYRAAFGLFPKRRKTHE